MNWDQVEGKWKQLRGKVQEKWGKLTNDDLDRIAGRREVFIGKLQERYGIAKEEAQKQADEWLRAQDAAATESAKYRQAGQAEPGDR
jgi:uncharacterized protein YjbJ (UPF0337 family)